jgi:hypothetical protein
MKYVDEQTPQLEQSGKPDAAAGGGGEGEGGGGEGEGGGGGGSEQIVKPVPVAEPSLFQVTVVPAANCTFIGPVVPEYAAFPIRMKS